MDLAKASARKIRTLYLTGFLFSVHLASISYINSSLIGHYVNNTVLDVLYIIGSIVSIIILALAPLFFRKYGSLLTLVFFAVFKLTALFGLIFAKSLNFLIFSFIVNISIDSILYLCLDIDMERETKLESTTGNNRGLFLTFQNIAWLLSPLSLIFLTDFDSFKNVYAISGIALFLFLIISVLIFENVKERSDAPSKMFPAFKSLFRWKDESKIIWTQFFLNFFYSWMIIYLPLLLHNEVGFGWDRIGIIFVIMLAPFVIFELPAGILSDKKYGEKEILAVGFIIMALATSLLYFIKTSNWIVWALVLFATRTGASFVEISSETYFFKHVKDDDTGLLSMFRLVRPVAYIMAPLIAIFLMSRLTFSQSFMFLAIFTILGIFFIPKVDTR